MAKDYICQFAIKYKINKVSDTQYIFSPVELLKGEETEAGFRCENGKEYPGFYDSIDPNRRYFVDMIYSNDELAFMYDYGDEEDIDFIGQYFFEDNKYTLMFVDTREVSPSGILYRNMLDLRLLHDDVENAIYYMDNSVPNVVLNEKAIREIRDAKTLKKVRLILDKYQKGLLAIKSQRDKDVTRISITGNKINYFETTDKVDEGELEEYIEKGGVVNPIEPSKDISYQGLRKYIKERIYGHDAEIDTFAQKLYMNYTAEKGETIESILFVGPTGTGKTKTVEVACDYLGIPMVEVNASNLIAAGYVGMSIEDVICSLYEQAGHDIEKAQRGLVFLDEFDKMSDVASGETKGPVKNILLTFTAGGTFPVSTLNYNFVFDSMMTNKVYAGVFERLTDKTNPMGFGAVSKRIIENLKNEEELRKKIIDKKYYTQEELTRISTILAYNDLPIDKKKDALLHSKISEYVKKRDRLMRQFGVELIMSEDCIEAMLDSQNANSTGMRNIYNTFKRIINPAERAILENEDIKYKKLILTRDTVEDPTKFDLSK